MHVLDVLLHFIKPQQRKKIKSQIKTEFTKLQVEKQASVAGKESFFRDQSIKRQPNRS